MMVRYQTLLALLLQLQAAALHMGTDTATGECVEIEDGPGLVVGPMPRGSEPLVPGFLLTNSRVNDFSYPTLLLMLTLLES